ncbi:DUF5753 domain-containing protein [Saccharopolyspora sp. 7B]|nr:DUF5753 domain-containing protein [Saccharopolyspora sp. 7B]
MANNFSEYVGLDAEADHVHEFAVDLIPGLLQTERYAKALMQAWLPQVDESVARDRANMRAERQQTLYADNPVSVSAVVGEAALRQLVGGADTMIDQLEHLNAMSELANVTVQVLPFSAGAVPALGAPFILLSFAEKEEPDIAYADYMTGCVYLEDASEVESYSLNFGALQDTALSPAASTEFIESIAGELRAR